MAHIPPQAVHIDAFPHAEESAEEVEITCRSVPVRTKQLHEQKAAHSDGSEGLRQCKRQTRRGGRVRRDLFGLPAEERRNQFDVTISDDVRGSSVRSCKLVHTVPLPSLLGRLPSASARLSLSLSLSPTLPDARHRFVLAERCNRNCYMR